ncbi:MAG: hypothetical protein WA951_07100 [Leeuwenhoekiella sp.]
MRTEFDYPSYKEGERYGIQFGLLMGTIIGLGITLAAVFILTALCN